MSGETKHGSEPWAVDPESPWTVKAADGLASALVPGGLPRQRADARRIVAAVNACAGIPTEALEKGDLAAALTAAVVTVDPGEPAASRRLGIMALRSLLRALGRLP